VNLVAEILQWFSDPSHWSGPAGVPARLVDHLGYTLQALLIAAVIAVPLGAWIGHTRRGGFLVVGAANGLRALPELGLLTLLVMFVGIGVLPLTIALVVLAVPPLLAGTYAGVRNADAAVIDAARGMGMREPEVLTKVELPIAVPLVLGGLRTATLQVIATATIGAYIGLSGLGRFLIDGLARNDYTEMAAGAVLVAVLALAVEGLLGGVSRLIVSPGLRTAQVRRRAPRQAPVFAGGTAS
jgi:osmoprotectant transport system permease protein